MRSSIYEAGFDQVRFILSHFHAKDEHFDYLMLRCTAVHACAVINEISVCSWHCACSVSKTERTKKALRETQTLRADCSKAEPNIFAPPQTPFPGAQDGQNFISWRCHYLHLQTQYGEDRCTQFRVIVVTDPQTNTHKHTHTHTNRQERLQYTAALSLARSVNPNREHGCRDVGL